MDENRETNPDAEITKLDKALLAIKSFGERHKGKIAGTLLFLLLTTPAAKLMHDKAKDAEAIQYFDDLRNQMAQICAEYECSPEDVANHANAGFYRMSGFKSYPNSIKNAYGETLEGPFRHTDGFMGYSGLYSTDEVAGLSQEAKDENARKYGIVLTTVDEMSKEKGRAAMHKRQEELHQYILEKDAQKKQKELQDAQEK